MLLKVRSTVAVVTGRTIKIAANFARLGNETEASKELAVKSYPYAVQIVVNEKASTQTLYPQNQYLVVKCLCFHQSVPLAHTHNALIVS